MKKVTAYCLEWHLKNSDAFRDLLITPLSPYLNIELTGWNGEVLPKKHAKNETVIFCMLPPTQEILNRDDLHVFWLPMWDQAQGYSDDWWNALPKNLQIISFSEEVHKKATKAGLTNLRLSYFKNPDESTAVHWKGERTLLYWNRVGMVGPEFIKELCKRLSIDTLIYKPDIDPGIESNKFYELPKKLGKTRVEIIHTTKSREEFLRITEKANIVLSPRLTEGVGMFYLEAMSRGCVVLAHNAPTMSEYITHGKNGILLDNPGTIKNEGLLRRLKKQETISYAPYLLSHQQPWKKISKLKLEKLGQQARIDHQKGYDKWQASLPEYARFLQD